MVGNESLGDIGESIPLEKRKRLQWFREARFGMFVHWGLYALPAGEWKGQQMDYIGEWIMSKYQIPVAEYAALAEQFNPQRFDAEAWVKLAVDAGMKYLTFTAKHHDGFAMYHSKADSYNIVDATPFGRDPVAELAEACDKHGLKFCLYYSQDLDWHEPDAGGTAPDLPLNLGMSWGNCWDFPDHGSKRFERYFEKKVKPQVTELLSNYGPIGLVWFDTPVSISPEQSEELVNLVRKLQPDCLINSRVGAGDCDYSSRGDNETPPASVAGSWETPATLNDTWGYKKHDHNWKTGPQIVRQLVDIASKGGNYLLNVGPTAEGIIPEPSCTALQDVGEWIQVNADAIYNTEPTPFGDEFAGKKWRCTAGTDVLYVHLLDAQACVEIPLPDKPVSGAKLLKSDKPVSYTVNGDKLTLQLEAKPEDAMPVVVRLELQE